MAPLITGMESEMRPNNCAGCVAVALLALGFAGCAGLSSFSGQLTAIGLKKRVLLSNQQAGSMVIVDAMNDKFSSRSMTVPGASKMATAGGVSAAIDSTLNEFSIIDDSKEEVTERPQTQDRVVDVAVSSDGKLAYAAVRDLNVVNVVNTTDGTVSAISVPFPVRLVLSPNGTKLLVFPDDPHDPQALVGLPSNSFFLIDTASKTVTSISGPSLDQPFLGVFNNSETQAFILNCGAECGGAHASVVRADFSGATPVFTASIPVSAATVGVLSGSSLFVAGTPPGSTSGTLQVISTGSLTASTPVSITNGKHLKMQMASNNRLYVGAIACTPMNDAATGLVRGCLTIFNTSSSAVVLPEFSTLRRSFDVTGIQPISNRTVVYVCEGGDLDIYDTTTDKLTANQLDVVGKAFDVVQIDP